MCTRRRCRPHALSTALLLVTPFPCATWTHVSRGSGHRADAPMIHCAEAMARVQGFPPSSALRGLDARHLASGRGTGRSVGRSSARTEPKAHSDTHRLIGDIPSYGTIDVTRNNIVRPFRIFGYELPRLRRTASTGLVDQNSASWNRIQSWLRRLETLQRAA